MYKILFLLPIVLTLFSIPIIQESFAESEYAISHFYSKGVLQNVSEAESAVVWTIVNGDKGTVISNYEGVNSITRLEMQPHYPCLQDKNIICINGIITSVKNSDISKVGDTIVLAYDVPHSQSFTFFDGIFAGTTLDIELSKFKAKDSSIIIKQKADEILDKLERESHLRILEGRHLLKHSIVQEELIQSNFRFFNLDDDASSEIEQRNQEWESAKPTVSSLEESIISNKASDLLREEMQRDSKKYGEFVIKEIILTNAYGVNVAQTGPTTDYMQGDEEWWTSAKLNGFDYRSGFDESAGVHSFDISMRVISKDATFAGIMKFVINTEPI